MKVLMRVPEIRLISKRTKTLILRSQLSTDFSGIDLSLPPSLP
jgi:hypothetical protein